MKKVMLLVCMTLLGAQAKATEYFRIKYDLQYRTNDSIGESTLPGSGATTAVIYVPKETMVKGREVGFGDNHFYDNKYFEMWYTAVDQEILLDGRSLRVDADLWFTGFSEWLRHIDTGVTTTYRLFAGGLTFTPKETWFFEEIAESLIYEQYGCLRDPQTHECVEITYGIGDSRGSFVELVDMNNGRHELPGFPGVDELDTNNYGYTYTRKEPGKIGWYLGINEWDTAAEPGISFDVTHIPWTSAVPEPSVWLYMVAGFGLVGASLRGRAAGAFVRR